jgi:hypothetical protein
MPGEFANPRDIRGEEHSESAELFVDEGSVEEFKNMKVDDWKYYLSNWTWWRAEVIYDLVPFTEHSMLFRYIKYLLIFLMSGYLVIHFEGFSKQNLLNSALR